MSDQGSESSRGEQRSTSRDGASSEREDAGQGRQVLRGAGSRLGSLAQALGRGAEATAARAKDVVDTTSERIDTFATHGPQGATVAEAGAGASVAANRPTANLRRTRKARLRISRVDPWSVMKTMFLFSVAFAIIQFVAVWIIWSVVGASGAFDSINKTVSDLVTSPSSTNNFNLQDYVNTPRVLGLTASVGVLDVLLFTALATLFSFLYNLAATVLGGLEITLAED